MNKAELVELLASYQKESKSKCKDFLDGLLHVLARKVFAKGKGVTWTNFGTFKVVKRKKRKGINPKTGRRIEIPAKNTVKFVPGKALKELVK